ncbi:MAG: hypothetical protein HQ564_10030 [Candidatus Saganbacteria bacterium]|nr:hypothetical protein [Candidatus Saganbacteria bacterium]
MKKFIMKWVERFLNEDMFEQVKTVQRVAILGFILFILAMVYVSTLTIDLSVPDESGTGRKIVAQKSLINLFLGKK